MVDYTIPAIAASTVLVALGFWYINRPVDQATVCKAQLDTIANDMENTLGRGIKTYYADFESYKAEDREYKLNYFQEELLKVLMKLDDVDLTILGDEKTQLKTLRKSYIKRIQALMGELDAWKKAHL